MEQGWHRDGMELVELVDDFCNLWLELADCEVYQSKEVALKAPQI